MSGSDDPRWKFIERLEAALDGMRISIDALYKDIGGKNGIFSRLTALEEHRDQYEQWICDAHTVAKGRLDALEDKSGPQCQACKKELEDSINEAKDLASQQTDWGNVIKVVIPIITAILTAGWLVFKLTGTDP